MSDTPQQVADSSGEDEAGIRNVLAGDVNAFATLERKYQRIVFFLVRKVIRDEGGHERSYAGCLGRVISGIAELPVRVPIFALAVHVCLYAFQA